MKLLLDANLSRRSIKIIQSAFPGSAHSSGHLGSGVVPDEDIFMLARKHGFALLTKDKDFISLSQRYGRPPLVILIMSGNGSRQQVEQLISLHQDLLNSANANPAISIVEIG
jgi:predicted nuclease of predicted toxin-antitoxin system